MQRVSGSVNTNNYFSAQVVIYSGCTQEDELSLASVITALFTQTVSQDIINNKNVDLLRSLTIVHSCS